MILILLLLFCYCRRNDSVIVILCRNTDAEGIKRSLISFEQRFNSNHHYPYVFFNDADWDTKFIETVTSVVSGDVSFQKIPPNDWEMPDWIDKKKAHENWAILEKKRIPYASLESYHNMCRFYSGKFFLQPSLKDYKYYWRIEPDVSFRCDIDFDPFEEMAKKNYIYGFTILFNEFMDTIPNLWTNTERFLEENKDLLPKDIQDLPSMFDMNKGKKVYNGCHFWSNLEIGDFDFFRSELYQKYFEKLDKLGEFYYSRVGDAPLHSLAVAELYGKKGIVYFERIGYTHEPATNCSSKGKNCDCDHNFSHNSKHNKCFQGYLNDKGNVL